MNEDPKTFPSQGGMIMCCTACEKPQLMPYEGGDIAECCGEGRLAFCALSDIDWKVLTTV